VAGILRVVDAGEIDEIDPAVGLERARDFHDAVAVDEERDLARELLRVEDGVVDAGDGGGHERIAFDVVDAARRRSGGPGRRRCGRRSRRRSLF
jgi:hypothetical protein